MIKINITLQQKSKAIWNVFVLNTWYINAPWLFASSSASIIIIDTRKFVLFVNTKRKLKYFDKLTKPLNRLMKFYATISDNNFIVHDLLAANKSTSISKFFRIYCYLLLKIPFYVINILWIVVIKYYVSTVWWPGLQSYLVQKFAMG